MIELHTLLHDDPPWEDVVFFFKDGEFYKEHFFVAAIKKHLLTEEQRKKLFDLNLSIEECLNGRYTGDQEEAVYSLYKEWNEKLGFKYFGF